MNNGEITRDDLKFLEYKNLGCWCKSKNNRNNSCHGDVIVELMDQYL